jgi:hypothetical protein
MIVIVKNLATYVSSRNLGLSLGEIHCSLKKLNNLNLFFSLGNNHVPMGEGTFFPGELGPFPTENSLLLG